MKKFDEETLMAYVDGELSEQESADIKIVLASDPEATKKVERFRKTRTAIDKFADILSEPIPEHLIETIRHHERTSDPIKFPERPWGGNWLKLAASIVIGISLGTIGTKFYLNQSQEKEAAIATSRMASLEKALKAAKEEKEIAQGTAATAEKNIAGLVRDLERAVAEEDVSARKAAAAETKIADISKALEVAERAKESALAKTATSEAVQQKMAGLKNLSKVFPLHLVDEALENGLNVSADLQKNILSDLNAESLSVSVASDTSEFSYGSTETVPLASAVEKGRSEDLEPGKTHKKDKDLAKASIAKPLASLGQSKKSLNILGEFSVAGKTCRLFEYNVQGPSRKLVLVACKKGARNWEIVQR